MTRRLAFGLVLFVTLGLVALTLPAGGDSAGLPDVYGDGVGLSEVTPIATILGAPEDFLGKTVRVEGKVREVCTKKGCWMELVSKTGDRLRVQVEEGMIVFPQEAVGGWAVAQGTVEMRELSREQYVNWQRHLASDRGEAFDDAPVGEGPFRLVQIAGTGAMISR